MALLKVEETPHEPTCISDSFTVYFRRQQWACSRLSGSSGALLAYSCYALGRLEHRPLHRPQRRWHRRPQRGLATPMTLISSGTGSSRTKEPQPLTRVTQHHRSPVSAHKLTSSPALRITAHSSWVTSGSYAGDCDEFDDPCMLATACTTSGSVPQLLSANSDSSDWCVNPHRFVKMANARL